MGDEDGPAEFTNADHLPPLLSGECISILAAYCGRCIYKMVSHPLRVSVFANAYRHRPKYRFNRNFHETFNPLLEIYLTNNYSFVVRNESNLIRNWTAFLIVRNESQLNLIIKKIYPYASMYIFNPSFFFLSFSFRFFPRSEISNSRNGNWIGDERKIAAGSIGGIEYESEKGDMHGFLQPIKRDCARETRRSRGAEFV